MKKVLYAAAAMLLAFAACNKPENNNGNDPGGNSGGDKKENTPIVLTASTTAPVMDKDHQDETALTLEWNATTNMGTGARVEYAVLMDRKGGSFEDAYEISLGTNVTSFSCTAKELSEIAKEHFGLQNDESAELDICIYATIKSSEVEDVISNKVTIKVTAFEPKPSILYLIGSATEAGWDQSKAPEMTPIEGEDGGFTWSGELFAGELKFLVTKDSWVPSYGKGDEEGTLYYRDHLWDDAEGNRVDDEALKDHDSPDPKFIIAEQGNYKIVLNIEKLTITITKTGGPKYFSCSSSALPWMRLARCSAAVMLSYPASPSKKASSTSMRSPTAVATLISPRPKARLSLPPPSRRVRVLNGRSAVPMPNCTTSSSIPVRKRRRCLSCLSPLMTSFG